jgi:hypothetical protein
MTRQLYKQLGLIVYHNLRYLAGIHRLVLRSCDASRLHFRTYNIHAHWTNMLSIHWFPGEILQGFFACFTSWSRTWTRYRVWNLSFSPSLRKSTYTPSTPMFILESKIIGDTWAQTTVLPCNRLKTSWAFSSLGSRWFVHGFLAL